MPPVAVTVLSRAPVPGRVKTRLAAAIGDDAACRLHVALTLDLLDALRAWAASRDAALVLALAGDPLPRDAFATQAAALVPALRVEEQGGGDLGARMALAVRRRLDEGAEACVVLGTDCLDVARRLDEVVAALAEARVALVRARDGGFVALGAALRVPSEGLEGLPWGSASALSATRDALAAHGVPVVVLEPPEEDVDDAPSLERLLARVAAGLVPEARRLRAWLDTARGTGR